MKLYYSPGACSLVAHIVAHELALPLALERVSMKTKQTETGADFLGINPNGYVPALALDDGQVLLENIAIVVYLANRKPGSELLPGSETLDHYRILQWLSFVSSEVHKSYGPLFHPELPDAAHEAARQQLQKRLGYIEQTLSAQPYLTGEHFTLADIYLYVTCNWAPLVKVDLSAFPNLQQFHARVAQRPAVQAAARAEGLIK